MRDNYIFFDMDGCLCALYDVEGWLPMLIASDPTPYAIAAPMHNMSQLARKLNTLQRKGYKLGIISWLSKDPNPAYGKKVTAAKLEWLKKHMPSVAWDYINIVPYGTPKHTICREGILFDDEEQNRENWDCGRAYGATCILAVLRELARAAA